MLCPPKGLEISLRFVLSLLPYVLRFCACITALLKKCREYLHPSLSASVWYNTSRLKVQLGSVIMLWYFFYVSVHSWFVYNATNVSSNELQNILLFFFFRAIKGSLLRILLISQFYNCFLLNLAHFSALFVHMEGILDGWSRWGHNFLRSFEHFHQKYKIPAQCTNILIFIEDIADVRT